MLFNISDKLSRAIDKTFEKFRDMTPDEVNAIGLQHSTQEYNIINSCDSEMFKKIGITKTMEKINRSDFKSWEEVAAYLQADKYNAVDVGGVFWYSETHSCCYDDCQCKEDYNSVVETLASIQYMCDGLHEVGKR